MILSTGDKIRLKTSGEGAEIVKVLDEHTAIIETFDGEIQVKSIEVIPFAAADAQRGQEEVAITFLAKPEKQNQPTKPQQIPFNQDRRNKFSYSLDLHAQQLIGNTDTKTPEEILSIQLTRCKAYLEEAIELRIQRVYIIHGIGSGRLKNEVHTMLHNHPKVIQFSNSYSPQYGMGATEVKLR